jgi:hypothetical protein
VADQPGKFFGQPFCISDDVMLRIFPCSPPRLSILDLHWSFQLFDQIMHHSKYSHVCFASDLKLGCNTGVKRQWPRIANHDHNDETISGGLNYTIEKTSFGILLGFLKLGISVFATGGPFR